MSKEIIYEHTLYFVLMNSTLRTTFILLYCHVVILTQRSITSIMLRGSTTTMNINVALFYKSFRCALEVCYITVLKVERVGAPCCYENRSQFSGHFHMEVLL